MRSLSPCLPLLVSVAACSHAIGGSSSESDGTESSAPGASPSGSGAPATPTPSAPKPKPKRVFVTSSRYSGNLEYELGDAAIKGAAAADALCQAAADAALLGGRFQAYIGDSTGRPHERITGTGPWVATHGKTVFNNKANLLTMPLSPLNADENGNPVGDPTAYDPTEYAWTGAGEQPDDPESFCANWAGDGGAGAGIVGKTDQSWRSQTYLRVCSAKAHLYCFEI